MYVQADGVARVFISERVRQCLTKLRFKVFVFGVVSRLKISG